jgi:hypothetical protein
MNTEWGIKVTTVELKDIQLPDSMKRRGRQPAAPAPAPPPSPNGSVLTK